MPTNPQSPTRADLLRELQQRVDDRVLEPTNAALLRKLILRADTDDEAIAVAALGTTYKRTGFHFDVRLERLTSDIRYLRRNPALSFTTSPNALTHRLIIGDNYEALQNLLISYRGKVDVIYIDPPYGKDSMGEFADTNYDNAITRDNLLSMLYPRLVLARQLLSDTGVIFCSIDDKNQAYVKCLFDEVFGEKNKGGVLLWQKKDKPSFLTKTFASRFEYVLCYLKDDDFGFPFSLETTTIGKKYPFNNAGNSFITLEFAAGSVHFNLPDGIVLKQDMSKGNIKTTLLDDVVIAEGINVNSFRLKGEFRYSQNTLDEIIAKGEIISVAQIPFRPNLIKGGGDIKKMENLLSKKFRYDTETNEDGTEELIRIIGPNKFDNPKPKGLVEQLIKCTTYHNKQALILDFFAGSGTTGHAVLELNRKDGGQRKFILCQLNEKTDTTPNGIAYDVTTKRLKRIMTGTCYDGTADFPWIKTNEPYGDNLEVTEIDRVFNAEATAGKTPFDVIDETLYGQKPFPTMREKIEWVCQHFQHTQRDVESDSDWEKRKRDLDHATRS